jgi:colicin import membrane protein
MPSRPRDLILSLKWPFAAAALVAGAFALIPAPAPAPSKPAAEQESSAASREAMRMLHDEHDRILDQIDRQRAQSEQKAAEDAHAFEEARQAAEQARIAAIREAERKLAEARAEAERKLTEARAAETKRVADAAVPMPREPRKPKAEPVAAGAPLDIVPVSGSESGPLVAKPRGPIETVVATVGDVTTGIKNKAVATVTGITDWFASAGDKLLGREKTPPQAPVPASRLSSSAD